MPKMKMNEENPFRPAFIAALVLLALVTLLALAGPHGCAHAPGPSAVDPIVGLCVPTCDALHEFR